MGLPATLPDEPRASRASNLASRPRLPRSPQAAYVGLAMQTTSKCTDARVASTFPLFALVLALLGLCWPACFAFAMAVPTCIAESPKSVRRLQEIFLALSYLPMFAWAVYGVAVVVPYWDGKYSAMDSCSQPVRTVRGPPHCWRRERNL